MTDGVWMSGDGKPCLPRHFFPHYAKSIHGKDHVSKGGMVTQMKELWFTKGFTTFAEIFCKSCVICNTHNVARGIKMSQVSQPTPTGPFEYLQMDFIELSTCGGEEILFGVVGHVVQMGRGFPNIKTRCSSSGKGSAD